MTLLLKGFAKVDLFEVARNLYVNDMTWTCLAKVVGQQPFEQSRNKTSPNLHSSSSELFIKTNLKPINSFLFFVIKEVVEMIFAKISIVVLKARLVSAHNCMHFVFFIESASHLK
jgi:hypothetical protein